MRYPWLDVLHLGAEEGAEPDCPRKFERWKEVEALETLEEYRSAIWNEIQQFRREVRGMLPSRRSSLFVDPTQTIPSPSAESEELSKVAKGLGSFILTEEPSKDTEPIEGLPAVEQNASRRLAPLPESGQAEAFEEEPQQTQEHSRIRKDSVVGGRLLRSLSTISVHEVTGGDSHQLYSKAAVGQYILEKSAADAPPSERPKEFA